MDNGYSCGVLKTLLSSDNHLFFASHYWVFFTMSKVFLVKFCHFVCHVKNIVSCKALSFFLWSQRCYLLQNFIDGFSHVEGVSLAKLCWFLLSNRMNWKALLNSRPFSLFVITCAFVLFFHFYFFCFFFLFH